MVAGIMFVIYYLGQEIFPEGHFWMENIWKLSGTSQGVILFKHIHWTEMLRKPMYEFLVGARTICFQK